MNLEMHLEMHFCFECFDITPHLDYVCQRCKGATDAFTKPSGGTAQVIPPREETQPQSKMINRHHILPKARSGRGDDSNLLRMKIPRHELLHKIFGLRTLEEIRDDLRYIFAVPASIPEPETHVPEFIDRLCRMKGRMVS